MKHLKDLISERQEYEDQLLQWISDGQVYMGMASEIVGANLGGDQETRHVGS
jgi:hypothetical protein